MSEPILVGVALRDDDTAPIALGIDLARFTGAPVVLTHVIRYEPSHRVPTPDYEAELRAEGRERLRQVAAGLPGDVEVEAITSSSAVRGLHDAALRRSATAVVVGSSHRGAVGRVTPGGVGERLLHAAPCAVAVAPRGYAGRERFRRLGVAFADTDEGREALSAGALLAALGDGELSVFSVLEPPHTGPGAATPGWIPPAPHDARPAMRAIEDRIRELLPDGMGARIVVQEGDPVQLLAEASADVDVLICGSRGYGPVRTVLLGGVSGRLVHTATCPVIVLARTTDRSLATA
jgi:nucleotide-binding universal stress UspA family protein